MSKPKKMTFRSPNLDEAVRMVEGSLPDFLWEVGRDDEHFDGPIIFHAAVRTREYLPRSWKARGDTPASALVNAATLAWSELKPGPFPKDS